MTCGTTPPQRRRPSGSDLRRWASALAAVGDLGSTTTSRATPPPRRTRSGRPEPRLDWVGPDQQQEPTVRRVLGLVLRVLHPNVIGMPIGRSPLKSSWSRGSCPAADRRGSWRPSARSRSRAPGRTRGWCRIPTPRRSPSSPPRCDQDLLPTWPRGTRRCRARRSRISGVTTRSWLYSGGGTTAPSRTLGVVRRGPGSRGLLDLHDVAVAHEAPLSAAAGAVGRARGAEPPRRLRQASGASKSRRPGGFRGRCSRPCRCARRPVAPLRNVRRSMPTSRP